MKPLVFCLLLLANGAFAVQGRDIPARVRYATEIVQKRMESEFKVPDYVYNASKCIAALRVVKAGFAWGGEGSTGLVSCRLSNGDWSTPSFFNTGGVSFGLQIGIQFMESMLAFMTDHSVDVLHRDTFQLGADISFAAGPVGGGSGTGVIPDAHVLTYNRSKGLYVGATLNGFVLTHNKQDNFTVYGHSVTGKILETPGAEAPETVAPFVEVLEKYDPGN